MASFNGLKTISATDIQNSGRFYLGNQLDSGTAGQALVSSGPDEPARWDTHTGTIQPLTMGTNLSLASGNPTFNGGTADTINATDTNTQLNLIEDNGIQITNTGGLNRTIKAKVDGTTVDFDGDELSVKKVPNDLTISQNGTIIDTFNGSTAKTIDLEGKYSAGDGIEISGHTIPVIEADTDEITISKNVGGAEQLQVLKVPNDLTFTGYATGTYNGSGALNINLVDTDTTYQGGTGISINTATNPDTINCSNIPNTALQNSTISGVQLGGSLANLTFYQADGTFITSYNGSTPPTSVILDGDTTYTGGKNITVDTTPNPDEIDLDDDLTGIDTITFTSTASAGATALTGNNYPAFGYQTPMTYFDLRSTTNIIPGGVLATVVQRTSLIRSFNTVYTEYSSNFRKSFVAQSSNVMVEFRAIVRADNKVFYGGLYNWNAGSWNTDQRNRFNFNDETDQDHTVLTWWMRNLTPGTTYYISPYFRGAPTSPVYIYAGHSGNTDGFAPAVMRIYDGGNNVQIY